MSVYTEEFLAIDKFIDNDALKIKLYENEKKLGVRKGFEKKINKFFSENKETIRSTLKNIVNFKNASKNMTFYDFFNRFWLKVDSKNNINASQRITMLYVIAKNLQTKLGSNSVFGAYIKKLDEIYKLEEENSKLIDSIDKIYQKNHQYRINLASKIQNNLEKLNLIYEEAKKDLNNDSIFPKFKKSENPFIKAKKSNDKLIKLLTKIQKTKVSVSKIEDNMEEAMDAFRTAAILTATVCFGGVTIACYIGIIAGITAGSAVTVPIIVCLAFSLLAGLTIKRALYDDDGDNDFAGIMGSIGAMFSPMLVLSIVPALGFAMRGIFLAGKGKYKSVQNKNIDNDRKNFVNNYRRIKQNHVIDNKYISRVSPKKL